MNESIGAYPPTPVRFGRVSVFMGSKNGKHPDGNQILIGGTETLVAFDTPLISNYIGPEFDNTELVILGHAHEDHMAGLHRLPNALVQVHNADLAAAQSTEGLMLAAGLKGEENIKSAIEMLRRDFFHSPRPDATGYEDGATWELGGSTVRAFHMPGHTPGHTVLVVEPEGVAFIGDIDLTGFGPFYGDVKANLKDFRQSIKKLPDIPARIWVTSHHRGIYTDRQRFLQDLNTFANVFEKREQRLLELLSGAPKSLQQLAEMRLIYPPGFTSLWAQTMEKRTIEQHLSELLDSGQVIEEEGLFRKN